MNGSLINSNFVVGMLVARDLGRQDQVFTGITAGQMGPSSSVGIIGLKRLVDQRTDFESRALRAEGELADLRAAATKVVGSVGLTTAAMTPSITPGTAAGSSPTGGASTPVPGLGTASTGANTGVGASVNGIVGQTIFIADDRRQYDPKKMRAFAGSKKAERRNRFVLLSNWPVELKAP